MNLGPICGPMYVYVHFNIFKPFSREKILKNYRKNLITNVHVFLEKIQKNN